MDPGALLHPVGPLAPRIYWIRRIVVVGGPLLLLVLLASCLGGGGSPVKQKAAGGASASSPSASRPSASATPAACETGQLSVTARVGAKSYLTGGPLPQLTVSVVNNGPAPCTRDVGPAQQSVTVYRGVLRVWSSADCASPSPQVRTLTPRKPYVVTLAWPRSRSSGGCPSTAPGGVDNGTYTVRGALTGVPPVEGGTFTLG